MSINGLKQDVEAWMKQITNGGLYSLEEKTFSCYMEVIFLFQSISPTSMCASVQEACFLLLSPSGLEPDSLGGGGSLTDNKHREVEERDCTSEVDGWIGGWTGG